MADNKKKPKSGGFESLGLSSNVYRAIKRTGYKMPTPIQRKTIRSILEGRDVVAVSRTGSGKTAAFLVPMLERLKQHLPQAGIRGLILSPTRELALQTLNFTKKLGRYTDIRTTLLVGGESMQHQFDELAQRPDIIIATPGRMMHHLSEVDDISLRKVEYVVFDEADSLFGMGFNEQLHMILAQLGENRQTLLFGATLPTALDEFVKARLHNPKIVRLDLVKKLSPSLTLTFFTMRQEEKCAALIYLIREHIGPDQQTLVFVSAKLQVEFLYVLLREEGIETSVCYGDMDQDARKINISKFRSRKTMLFIATDVAARGINIPLLDNVIIWDFPPTPQLFIHRVGRVARLDRTGTAYSFLTAESMPYLLDLHLFLSKPVRPAPTEEELLQDMDGVISRINQAVDDGETVYGRLPQSILDLVSDRVREILDSSVELASLLKACTNAFRMYMKTKSSPSRESIRRAKLLPREGLHPLFRGNIEGIELSALAFSERLKSFKPKQTILEAEGEAAKLKRLQGLSSQWDDVMKKKKAIHDEIINLAHKELAYKQQLSNEMKEEDNPEIIIHPRKDMKVASGSKRKERNFKDEEYFINSVPTNRYQETGLAASGDQGFGSNRLDYAVLDMQADDSAGMQKQKTVYHWDKRSKKYMKLNNGVRVTASGKVKTESGKKVKATKTGIYEKWKARTHNRVSSRQTDGDDTPEAGSSSAAGRLDGRFKGGKTRHSAHNSCVRSEIKDLEQVRKERQMKAKRSVYLKAKSNDRKKFDKNKVRKGKKNFDVC